MSRKIALIGYSGHAFVVEDALFSAGAEVFGYFEKQLKEDFTLHYLGDETAATSIAWLLENDFVVAIGDNKLRAKKYADILQNIQYVPLSVIHPRSSVSKNAKLGHFVQILNGAIVQPYAEIGKGTICNTSAIIEHECVVGEYCHISCGAVLCGNVRVGDFTFVGANAVIRQGIKIGDNVIIGAGAVIVKDVPSNSVVVGNPMRFIKDKNKS